MLGANESTELWRPLTKMLPFCSLNVFALAWTTLSPDWHHPLRLVLW